MNLESINILEEVRGHSGCTTFLPGDKCDGWNLKCDSCGSGCVRAGFVVLTPSLPHSLRLHLPLLPLLRLLRFSSASSSPLPLWGMWSDLLLSWTHYGLVTGWNSCCQFHLRYLRYLAVTCSQPEILARAEFQSDRKVISQLPPDTVSRRVLLWPHGKRERVL